MKNNLKIKKNQHYVPQSYLRRFAIEGEKSLLWSFDKEIFEFNRSPSSIKKICAEDYYYYQQDGDGGFDHIQFEDSLSEIEKIGNDILNKIVNVYVMPYPCISEQERGELSFYIALMLTRGPAFRDCINELHGEIVSRSFRRMYDDGLFPEPPEILSQKVKEKGLENIIKTLVFSSVSLQGMVESARQISLTLIEKNWILMFAPKGLGFITSDTPVSFVSAAGKVKELGPGHPEAKIIFPISKKSALVISGQRGKEDYKVVTCDKSETKSINQIIANSANKLIFCSEKYEWLSGLITERSGQKLSLNSSKSGYEIIKNPYRKRKREKHS